MKKIAITLFLLMCMFFETAYAASMILEYDGAVRNYTGNVYDLQVNGKKLTNLPLEPIIFNDRALVPVREIFEAMGATVDYEASDKSIDITHGKTTVYLKIDSPIAKVNGVKKNIPDNVAPKLIAKWGESAKTMVPVRFISESIGMDVEFSERDGLISITDPNMTVAPTNTLKKITFFEDSDIVQIRISAKNAITSMTKPAVTEAGVIYTDIANMSYEISNKTAVDLGAVTAVRLGAHDSSTRIAVDTKGMKKYSVELSDDKKTVIIKVTPDSSADINQNTNLPTASPAPSQKPTQKPSRPVANPGEIIVVLDAGHGGSDPGVVRNRLTDAEMEEWLKVKNQPAPTATPTPSPSPTPDASKEPTASPTEAPTPSATPAPSKEPTIWDGGTGKLYKEKDIALSVAQKVKKLLEANDIKVIMTRSGDTYPTLDERPELAIEKGAALFLSIHVNSTNDTVSTANGIEIYYSTQNNSDDYGINSKTFAELVQKNVIANTKAKDRGVKTANYLVVRKATMPAALIEMGFLNNPEELEKLISEEYQDKIAKGISKGIISATTKVVFPAEAEETENTEETQEAK